jgi:hypothetical protein
MQIKNIQNLKVSEIKQLVQQGGKFVIFPYTISFVIMTLRRNSDIYFIRPDEGTFKYSYGYILLNFFIGWWGFPWGPIYTISAIYKHIIGGNNVTQIVLSDLMQRDPEVNTTTYSINENVSSNSEQVNSNNQTYNIPR